MLSIHVCSYHGHPSIGEVLTLSGMFYLLASALPLPCLLLSSVLIEKQVFVVAEELLDLAERRAHHLAWTWLVGGGHEKLTLCSTAIAVSLGALLHPFHDAEACLGGASEGHGGG